MSFLNEERAAELRNLFFESTQELLLALNEQGLELEKRPQDGEIVRGIRRSVHTLKGDSAACGFRELSALAHELEDVLTPELAERAGAALADVVLSAADMFEAFVAAYQGKIQPPKPDPLRAMIARLVNPAASKEGSDVSSDFDWTEYEQLAISQAIAGGMSVYNLAIKIDPNCPMRAAAVQLLLKVLAEAGTVLATWPEEPGESVELLRVALASHFNAEWLERKCHIPSVVESIALTLCPAPGSDAQPEVPPDAVQSAPPTTAPEISPSPAPASDAAAAAADSKPKDNRPAEASLRVDAERIDVVMNLVGELIIGKSMLFQTVNEFGRRFPKDPLRTRFSDAMIKQSQVLNALQRSVMKIRMVPVEQLFRRFPRVVRDTAKACEKSAAMVMQGKDTDLDKSILDALAEPLAHLVRNAVDHGLETPEERTRVGKPAQGTITLNAYHQGNHIVMEVTDDGRGLDPDKILAKAVEKGMISAEEGARLTDQQKLDFIFESGFSTADQVTNVSGRGVGMDIVRSVLSRLKGTVTIDSALGKGTTFRLTLPLTLAIIKALLFHVGDQVYAVPLSSVLEITRVNDDEIHEVDAREVFRVRDQLINLVRLSRLLPDAHESTGKHFVVVVGMRSMKFGLIVDRLFGEDELVIKAIDDYLVATELVSGASILGDGTVVLILNIPAFIDRVVRYRPAPMNAAGPRPPRCEVSA